MSRIIDQFKAERDRELQEIDDQYAPRLDKLLLEAKEAKETWDNAAQNINKQRRLPTEEEEGIKIAWENASLRYNALIFEWKFAQEAVRRKTKSRIVAFYQNHSEEIRDILDLVKEEIPMLIFTASLKVNNEHSHKEQNRRDKEKGIVRGDSENKTNDSDDKQLIYDVTFSDDSLRRYLNSSLKSYIDLLKNVSPESYKEANSYIEECIADKGHIVIRQRELFRASQLKADITMPTVLNANTQRAKEAVFGVTKVEGAAFEPSKNDFLYNDLIPVNIDVGVLKKRTVSTVVSIDFNNNENDGRHNRKRTEINALRQGNPQRDFHALRHGEQVYHPSDDLSGVVRQ